MSPEAPPDADVAEREPDLNYAFRVLDSLHGQVRIADEKIRGIFSASALLAAAIAVRAGQTYQSIATDGLTGAELTLIGMRALLLLIVGFSLVSAILALLPRTKARKAARSLVFFGDIAATDHDAFIEEFARQGARAAQHQILSQVHVNAVIVQAKYVWTRRAASSFIVAILCWIAVQTIEFLL
jgi:hypothetical protein